MNSNTLSVIGLVLGGVSSAIALFIWFRYISTIRIYTSLLKTFNSLKSENKQINKSLFQAQGLVAKHKNEIASFELDRLQLKERLKESKKQVIEQKRNFEKSLETACDRIEHHKSQEEALLKQIVDLDKEKTMLTINYNSASDKLDSVRKEEELLRCKENSNLSNKLNTLRENKETLHKQLKKLTLDYKGSAENLAKYKRKAAQLSMMMKVEKGKREIIEERNENWERALKLLCESIFKDLNIDSSSLNLGQLVSKALEIKIQEELIPNDHFFDESYPV